MTLSSPSSSALQPLSLADTVTRDIEHWFSGLESLLSSERDMQMNLASWLAQTGHYDKVELEYALPAEAVDDYIWKNDLCLDIVLRKGAAYLPVKLTYKTLGVKRKLERFGEPLAGEYPVVRELGAQDIGKYDFWRDVKMLELLRRRFRNIAGGLAVLLTNDAVYTKPERPQANHYYFSTAAGVTARQKRWLRPSKLLKNYPDFELEQDYELVWSERIIDREPFHLTLVRV